MSIATPAVMARIVAVGYASQQITFFMYHYNSYAANPVMLRSTKPMVMRDFFLTPCRPHHAYQMVNPLCGLYVLTLPDALWNSTIGAAVAYPAIHALNGARHVCAVYFLGSIFSSFAYVFQMESSKTKRSTDFDYAAMSSGACAAVCTMSLACLPGLKVPGTRAVPSAVVALAYLARCFVDEYGMNPFNISGHHAARRGEGGASGGGASDGEVAPSALGGASMVGGSAHATRLSETRALERAYLARTAAPHDHAAAAPSSSSSSPPSGGGSRPASSSTRSIELTNWGFVGGAFLGLMYGSLVIGVRRDASTMRRFWGRMPNAVGGAASNKNKHS